MVLGKTYIGKTGAKRTPVNYSECGRYINVRCEYPNGTQRTKYFHKDHELFNDN